MTPFMIVVVLALVLLASTSAASAPPNPPTVIYVAQSPEPQLNRGSGCLPIIVISIVVLMLFSMLPS